VEAASSLAADPPSVEDYGFNRDWLAASLGFVNHVSNQVEVE
jgi:hypothetical protein